MKMQLVIEQGCIIVNSGGVDTVFTAGVHIIDLSDCVWYVLEEGEPSPTPDMFNRKSDEFQ